MKNNKFANLVVPLIFSNLLQAVVGGLLKLNGDCKPATRMIMSML